MRRKENLRKSEVLTSSMHVYNQSRKVVQKSALSSQSKE